MSKIKNIGIEKHLSVFDKCLSDFKEGKGSIIAISGEEGYGKTFLLNSFADRANEKESGIKIIIEKNVSPIGSFNIGNIQPLLPFMRVMEKILLGETYDKSSAMSKFMKSAGLTFLASVPVIDTLFYAVKEFGRDWRQYQKDKSSEKRGKSTSSTTNDFFDTFSSLAEKKQLIIMLDDFHWSDAQSVELLDLLAEDITSIPIIIVIAYRKSIVDSQASPLISFINDKIDKAPNIFGIQLKEFSKKDISNLIAGTFDGYSSNETFEEWLYNNSFGVPGVLSEYLKYFKINNPFKSDGSLNDNFFHSDYLPATIHSAFSKTIEKLSDEDKNILSICASEGRECTAIVMSNLLSTDILTTIKKLRSLQQNSGIIRSIGAHHRYGVKTTIYEFTQAFYKKYFEGLLEYEEYVALHGQISAFLKTKYNEAESEATKHEIAPYLAAHSMESGDEETAKSMLLVSAQAAQKYGNATIVRDVYDRFKELGVISNDESNPDAMAIQEIMRNLEVTDGRQQTAEGNFEGDDTGNGGTGSVYQDFIAIRKIIVEYYHKNKYDEAVEYALNYLNKNEEELRSSEIAQILAIIIKSYVESGQTELAENYSEKALNLIESHNDPIAECFVMNSLAVLRCQQGRKDEMLNFLKKAAQKAIALSPELRLLTLSNIALLTEESEPAKARRYYESVRRLASSLNYEQFSSQVLG
ncbi:MAG: AAA family ATPase [bacterium]